MAEVFRTKYPDVAGGIKTKDAKFCVDLAAYAKTALNKVGVEDIEDCGLSTFADAERFYSYRRDASFAVPVNGDGSAFLAASFWIQRLVPDTI